MPPARGQRDLVDRLTELFKAVGHPVRLQILGWVLTSAVDQFSASEVSEALGAPLGLIAYHVRCLSIRGLIAPAGEKKVGGARQYFYALTPAGEHTLASISDFSAERSSAGKRAETRARLRPVRGAPADP